MCGGAIAMARTSGVVYIWHFLQLWYIGAIAMARILYAQIATYKKRAASPPESDSNIPYTNCLWYKRSTALCILRAMLYFF
jgi:hypothetical protein